MLINPKMTTGEHSDSELVARSLAGDREAFGQIVSRYQTLICSLAYSRIGHLGLSEDVAQETFITAWKHLRLLREPAKLRAWLCGIVRNRVHKSLHREAREPVHNAEPLELVCESPANEALPSEHAVSREEAAILWRSLQRIPEIYREPLILFYREHQSIEAVAVELDLSEDAVKQRLSRGRKLLQQEVQTFVEKTLRRTAPSHAFSGAVLAALPAGPATTVGASVVGKGAAAAKSGFLATWFAPVLGILGGIIAHWLIVRAAPSAPERRLKKIAFIGLWIFVLVWCIPGLMGMRALGGFLDWSETTYFRVMAGFWWLYAVLLATLSILMFRRLAAIRSENATAAGISRATGLQMKALSGIILVGGVHLAYFSWLVALALRARDLVSAGVIAAVMVALAIRNILLTHNGSVSAALQAIARHHALIWGIILVILNVRLGAWVANLNGVEPREISRLLPTWIIPLFTLALAAWMSLLLKITRPNRL